MPRLPRLRRPRGSLLVIVAVAMLAFPLGVLASHQFSDVPDSSQYHADIDAIADAGVTTGCGGGEYCPTANVTREQMAAFMNRLGALGPGKTPVVNATRTDGWDVGCPAGTTWAGGLCLETSVRTASSVYEAGDTCTALGGSIFGRGQQWMLPTALQLRGAANNDDIVLTGTGEWSSDLFVSDADGFRSIAAYPFFSGTLLLDDDAGADHVFRCGAVPLSFDGLSIILPLGAPESGLPAAGEAEGVDHGPTNNDGSPAE